MRTAWLALRRWKNCPGRRRRGGARGEGKPAEERGLLLPMDHHRQTAVSGDVSGARKKTHRVAVTRCLRTDSSRLSHPVLPRPSPTSIYPLPLCFPVQARRPRCNRNPFMSSPLATTTMICASSCSGDRLPLLPPAGKQITLAGGRGHGWGRLLPRSETMIFRVPHPDKLPWEPHKTAGEVGPRAINPGLLPFPRMIFPGKRTTSKMGTRRRGDATAAIERYFLRSM